MRVLAGHIGGTTARLAICDVDGTTVLRDIQAIYASPKHDSLEVIAREFIASNSVGVEVACFGVPGPVRGRRARATNLPWELDADVLERNLGIKSVHLINDLEATARGLATLADADFLTIREGPGVGNQGLLAAGAGLGEAGLYWDGRRHRAFACEGGHTDFAPGSAREDALLSWLRTQCGPHVSWERVISRPGLVNLYEFLRTEQASKGAPSVEEARAGGEDVADAILRAGTRGSDALCTDAVQWFMELHGAEAGNVALKYLATGGMFIAGPIAPKIAKALKRSRFVERFAAKGRMEPLLKTIPLRIVTNDSAALQGAAYYAARRARGEID